MKEYLSEDCFIASRFSFFQIDRQGQRIARIERIMQSVSKQQLTDFCSRRQRGLMQKYYCIRPRWRREHPRGEDSNDQDGYGVPKGAISESFRFATCPATAWPAVPLV
jgi:hypothetical protein